MEIDKINEIIEKNIQRYKRYFGYACLFGSLKNDIDFFIIPAKNIEKGLFLKKLVSFLEDIKRDFFNFNKKIQIIWHSTYEEEAEYIINKKDLLKIHISSFPDINPLTPKKYLKSLQDPQKIFLGDYSEIKEIKKTKIDYYYNYLFISNCLFSGYPKELEKEKILSKVNYIYKHLTGKEKDLSKSPKEEFLKCCDNLDRIKT